MAEQYSQETVLSRRRRIKVLDASIDSVSASETVALTEQYIIRGLPLHLVGVNADKLVRMRRDRELRELVNSCGIISADGASVVLASRFLGDPLPEKVPGVDLMWSLVELSARKGYEVFLLGARQMVVEKAADAFLEKYPTLKICGIHDGYFQREDWPEISALLKYAAPRLVLVGISSPIKEQLIEYLQADGNNCVFMGVGGSFDVASGLVPRAPMWMRRLNLEWFYRLIREPRRLFGRYVCGNTVFVFAVLRERLRRRSTMIEKND